MRYHMTEGGLILPCRNILRRCPYPAVMHRRDFAATAALYHRQYNHVAPPQVVLNRLQNGAVLQSLNNIAKTIEVSPAPVALICNTLMAATRFGHQTQLTQTEYDELDEIVRWLISYHEIGIEVPANTPSTLDRQALLRELPGGGAEAFRLDLKHHWSQPVHDAAFSALHKAFDGNREHTLALVAKYENPNRLSPAAQKDYFARLDARFIQFARLLNTRKLVQTPRLFFESDAELRGTLKQLTPVQLNTVYDYSSMADATIEHELAAVDGFAPLAGLRLAPGAQATLDAWLAAARQEAALFVKHSAVRALVAAAAYDELVARGLPHGDRVIAYQDSDRI